MTGLRKPLLSYFAVTAGFLSPDAVDAAAASEAILDYAKRVYACDAAALILAEKGQFRVASAHGWERSDLGALLAETHAEDVLLLEVAAGRRVPMIVEDTRQSPLWAALPALHWILSHAAVPLVFDGSVLAILCLEGHAPGMFVQSDSAGLDLLGLQAAMLLHRCLHP